MQFYVKDIMSTDIVTVEENATVRELVEIFSKNEIMGVPVVKDSLVTGVVSASDIIKGEMAQSFYDNPRFERKRFQLDTSSHLFDAPVYTLMSDKVFTVGPDDTISSMAKIMYEKKVHRLLVTEYDKLVGIVSTFDLLKLLASTE